MRKAPAGGPVNRLGPAPVAFRLQGAGEQRPGIGILQIPAGSLVGQLPRPRGVRAQESVADIAESTHQMEAIPTLATIMVMLVEMCLELRPDGHEVSRQLP